MCIKKEKVFGFRCCLLACFSLFRDNVRYIMVDLGDKIIRFAFLLELVTSVFF